MERLAASADFVIVDSPPLQAVTDAAILSSLVDGTILVVDAGRTRSGAVRNGREALAKVGARVLGVALNRMSESMSGDYYYYDYYGGYGADGKTKSARASRPRRPRTRGRSGHDGAGGGIVVRVLITGIYYRPELTAIGPYTAGLAEHLARRGDEVTVVTGLPHYPGWRIAPGTRRALWARESIDGVEVIRAAHYVPRTQSALRRAAYEGTFGLTGLLATLALPRPDAILGIVPSLGGGLLARVSAGTSWRPLRDPVPGPDGPAAAPVRVRRGWAVAGATTVGRGMGGPRRARGRRRGGARSCRTSSRSASRQSGIHHVAQLESRHGAAISRCRRRAPASGGRTAGRSCSTRATWATSRAWSRSSRRPGSRQSAATPCGSCSPGAAIRRRRSARLRPDLPNVDFLGSSRTASTPACSPPRTSSSCPSAPARSTCPCPASSPPTSRAGRPIVAAVPDGGASATEIERSGAGLVVPAGEPEALLEALARFRTDPDLACAAGGGRTCLRRSQHLRGGVPRPRRGVRRRDRRRMHALKLAA